MQELLYNLKNNTNGWANLLNEYFDQIESLLGVQKINEPESYLKYTALKKLAHVLGGKAEPAPVAINLNGEKNPFGVITDICNRCGNCIQGCHSGAKNTLNLNAWPLAKQLGVNIYTGVYVKSLEENLDSKSTKRWIINSRLSRNDSINFQIFSDNVILSAGTFGSTEILKQSKKLHISK